MNGFFFFKDWNYFLLHWYHIFSVLNINCISADLIIQMYIRWYKLQDRRSFEDRSKYFEHRREMKLREMIREREREQKVKFLAECPFKPDLAKPAIPGLKEQKRKEAAKLAKLEKEARLVKIAELAGRILGIQADIGALDKDYQEAMDQLKTEFDRLKADIEQDETERVLEFLRQSEGRQYLREKVHAVLAQGSSSDDNVSDGGVFTWFLVTLFNYYARLY